MNAVRLISILAFWLLLQTDKPCTPGSGHLILIPAGNYHDFMSPAKSDSSSVEAFYLDQYPVTNADFMKFLAAQPQWGKQHIKTIYGGGPGYLKHITGPLSEAQKNQPVVNVSWYAAEAYCSCMGKRLPTLAEWEYAAAAPLKGQGNKLLDKDSIILQWYGKPMPKSLPPVSAAYVNTYGVAGMHGLVWEWVDDFNSVLIPKDTRGTPTANLFCGSASAGRADPSDYASFMRYAFRSSIKAQYTGKNLGFRCAKDAEKNDKP